MKSTSSAKVLQDRYLLSESGIIALQNRREELQQRRVENIERLRLLKEQQSDGVSLEDSSYIQTFSTIQFLEGEIEKISYVLSNAKIVSEQDRVRDAVAVGSLVRLEGEGKQFEYTIVNSIEADPSVGKISDQSPLGQQLIGKRLEDMITLGFSPKKKPLMLRLTGIS